MFIVIAGLAVLWLLTALAAGVPLTFAAAGAAFIAGGWLARLALSALSSGRSA